MIDEKLNKLILFYRNNYLLIASQNLSEQIPYYKNGNKIHIKKKNKGKFTDWCGSKVTDECILKGKHSNNPIIRKRATFAANARKWKH